MTCEQKKIKLAELDRKRKSLGTLIYEWIDRNKSPRDIKFKVKEYEDLTFKMRNLGSNVCIRAPQLHSDFWDNHTVDDLKKIKNKPIVKSPPKKIKEKTIIKEVYIEPQKNYYILNIVWDDDSEESVFNDYKRYIQPYLGKICVNVLGINNSEDTFSDRIEYEVRCKIKCSEDTFDIIKKSIQYIIDINKLKIEIYGKKRN